jgi:hypothetical protein
VDRAIKILKGFQETGGKGSRGIGLWLTFKDIRINK